MIATVFALSAALILPAPGSTPAPPIRALMQEAAPSAAASDNASPAESPMEQMILPGATRAPDCGGREQLAQMAFCVTAPITQMGALGEAYIARMGEMGWLPADGSENLVIFVRRREAGGCDGVQMIAFYNEDQPVEETSPAYLAFAVIPGDVCAAQPAAPAVDQPVSGETPQ